MESRKKRKTKQTALPSSSLPLCKLITYLVSLYLLSGCLRKKLPGLQRARGRGLINVYLLGATIVFLIAAMIVIVILVLGTRSARRRKALEEILERYHQSGQALLRYVMLNRQCSEEAAYQRIAIFVKQHIPLDDYNSIDLMLASDRQSLLDTARSILVYDPDEIDKI
jgi:hypothetical protein